MMRILRFEQNWSNPSTSGYRSSRKFPYSVPVVKSDDPKLAILVLDEFFSAAAALFVVSRLEVREGLGVGQCRHAEIVGVFVPLVPVLVSGAGTHEKVLHRLGQGLHPRVLLEELFLLVNHWFHLVEASIRITGVAVIWVGMSELFPVPLHQFLLFGEKKLRPIAATVMLSDLDELALRVTATHVVIYANDHRQTALDIILAMVDAHHGANINPLAYLRHPILALLDLPFQIGESFCRDFVLRGASHLFVVERLPCTLTHVTFCSNSFHCSP